MNQSVIKYIACDPDEGEYSEADQSASISFSCVNKIKEGVYKEMFPPVLCRDYFSDILEAEFQNKVMSTYGFKYNPKKQRIDRDKIRLGIHGEFERLLPQLPIILGDAELASNFDPTTITKIDDTTLLLEGDARWQDNTLLLSIYTLLIRMSAHEYVDVKNWHTQRGLGTDDKFLDYAGHNLVPLLSKLDKVASLREALGCSPSGWKDANINTVHNFSGVISFLADENKNECWGWVPEGMNDDNVLWRPIREILAA